MRRKVTTGKGLCLASEQLVVDNETKEAISGVEGWPYLSLLRSPISWLLQAATTEDVRIKKTVVTSTSGQGDPREHQCPVSTHEPHSLCMRRSKIDVNEKKQK